MNKTETKKTQSALNQINKCNGICKACENIDIRTASCFYAFTCKIAQNAGYDIMSNTIADLKNETLSHLQWELA